MLIALLAAMLTHVLHVQEENMHLEITVFLAVEFNIGQDQHVKVIFPTKAFY